MLEVTRYKCQYCGKEYHNDAECAEHESNHREPIGISAATYFDDGGAEHGAPRVLLITFPEDRCARYVFREWERKEG